MTEREQQRVVKHRLAVLDHTEEEVRGLGDRQGPPIVPVKLIPDAESSSWTNRIDICNRNDGLRQDCDFHSEPLGCCAMGQGEAMSLVSPGSFARLCRGPPLY